MLGHKSREFKQQVAICLETLVPPHNFYRQVDQCIDLGFVHELAEDFYLSFWRPSIDTGMHAPALGPQPRRGRLRLE